VRRLCAFFDPLLRRAPRPSLPFRQLTDAEMADDSLFAPRAIQGLQRYKNYVASQAPKQSAGDAGSAATLDALFGRMMANQMGGAGGLGGMGNMFSTSLNSPWNAFNEMATDDDYAELARLTKGAKPAGAGMFAGGFVKNGRHLDDPALNRLQNKYRVAY
jgi:hypothetical protein